MAREVNVEVTTGLVRRKRNPIGLVMLAACLCFVVSLGAGIGGTYATITQAQKHTDIEPYFDAKLVQKYAPDGETAAYPGFTCERSAVAQNIGKQTCWVRMRIEKKWLERDTNAVDASATNEDSGQGGTATASVAGTSGKWVESSDRNLNADYIEVAFADTENWQDGGDGWYYYLPSIEPGQSSSSLLSGISISAQVGEEYNDNQTHESSSIYVDKAAEVDVYMEATAYPYETQGGLKRLPQTGDTSLTLFIVAGIAFLVGLALVIGALVARHSHGVVDEESFVINAVDIDED